MELRENKKEAVLIGINLSIQLITAALAMVAIMATIAAYILEKRNANWMYWCLSFLSFLSFVSSIFKAGKAIEMVRKNGFDGKWELQPTNKHFDLQARLCGLGIIFFLISIVTTGGKSEDLSKITTIEKEIMILKEDLAKVKSNITSLTLFIDSLETKTIDTAKLSPKKRTVTPK